MKQRCVKWWFAFVAIAFSMAASAHGVGTSYINVDARTDALAASVSLPLRDLEFAVGLDSDGNGSITWGEVKANQPKLTAWLKTNMTIVDGGAICQVGATSLDVQQRSDGPYVLVAFPLTCKGSALGVQSNLFFDVDPSHRTLISVNTKMINAVSVLTSENRIWRAANTSSTNFWRFSREGIWHIWTGYDHLAFLLLLILPLVFRSESKLSTLRATIFDVLSVVTAFTLAHSITLATAAFDFVRLPSRWVEATIAASIVVAAVISVLKPRAKTNTLLAFGFGLIHGLGFASALAELTQNQNRLLPLLGFNVGVELGQLAVVAAILPLLIYMSTKSIRREYITGALSTLVGLAGMIWFVERLI